MLILLLLTIFYSLIQLFNVGFVYGQSNIEQISINTNNTNLCPVGWFNFGLSCYKFEKRQPYGKAMQTCRAFKKKNNPINRIHLVTVESSPEMDFLVNTIMVSNDVQHVYIGLNDLRDKTIGMTWERSINTTLFDPALTCLRDIEGYSPPKNNTNFCGVLQNFGLLRDGIQSRQYNPSYQSIFCLNTTTCLTALPFICEINCTHQENQCRNWTAEYNLNLTLIDQIKTPCLLKKHSCKNNSTCVSNSTDSYTCLCEPGYNGTLCELDERPCLPHKSRCRNNSTCTQHGWRYNCSCQSGFTGYHCEINIDDCVNATCFNGGICIDEVDNYRCECVSYYSGYFCEHKDTDLVIKEQVSRSFSVLAIVVIILTYGFFLSLDALRYVFRIEPQSLSQERNLIRKKKLIKKITKDLKSKKKRKKYFEIIAKEIGDNNLDPFILNFEKVFKIHYDTDLRFIDESIPNLTNQNSEPYKTVVLNVPDNDGTKS